MKEWIKIRKTPAQWAFVLILSLSFAAQSITVTGQSFSSAVGAKSLAAKAKRNNNNNNNRKRELYKRLASEATFVKQVNKKKDNNFFEKNNNDVPEFMFVNTGYKNTKSRQLEDGDDDTGTTTTSTLDDDYAFAQEFGYDYNVLKYSLKYVKCQAIQTFSDNMAEDENESNVLITKRFIVFRLCNSNDCDSSSDDIFGCEYDYGEYILEMELYLQIMQQYLEERKEAYCDFCEECMEEDGRRERRLEEEAQQDDTDAQEDDASEAQEDEEDDTADGDDGGEEDDGTEAAEEDDDDDESDVGDDTTESVTSGNNGDDDTITATTSSQQEVQNGCAYYDECYDYEDKCEDNQDDDGYIDYSEYFECQQYNNNNGNNGDAEMYIGAHCGYDGQSIVIGLYYDQYCSEFAGYDIDIAEYTGIQFQEDGLQDYYSSDCISCKESELPYEQVEGDQEDDDDVSEICEDIYFNSGRCHSYLENDAGYVSSVH